MTACPSDDCDTEAAGEMAGAEEMAAGAEEECEEEGGSAGGDTAGGETAGGDDGGTPGDGEGGDTAGDAVTAYDKVVIVDTTTEVNDDGTPGVDICEILVECDGSELDDSAFVQEPGSPVCDGSNNDNCLCVDAVDGICGGTDRTDGSFAFDGDASCENDNWLSLGIGGAIAYENSGLEMCAAIDVTVTERDGPQMESYTAALCSSDVNEFDISNMLFNEACTELGSGGSGTTPFSWAQ